jgi:cell division protein ZapE
MFRSNLKHKDLLTNKYQQLVAKQQIKPDDAQFAILQKLQILENDYSGFFSRRKIKGIYIYGDVGRGKSMLMNLFFTNSQIKNKRRIHFHEFMRNIHGIIHNWRNDPQRKDTDPVIFAAKEFAGKTKLLCFDEFQVTDIADAMILGKLFRQLRKMKLIIVTTSNRKPSDLYLGGIQREKFLEFVQLLEENFDVISLDSKIDYRLQQIQAMKQTYFYPLGSQTNKAIKQAFAKLTSNSTTSEHEFTVQGHKFHSRKSASGVALFSFADLCAKPLGSADYAAIAKVFSTVFLIDIPKLTREDRNEAKRFVILIDELYEHKVKLIISAECSVRKIYKYGDGSFEFNRTVSRLIEMQSAKYLS